MIDNNLFDDKYNIKHLQKIKGRLLGIDFGEKRIGIAVSDFLQTLATPCKVLCNDKKFFQELLKILEEYEIKAILIGIPRSLDGTYGNTTKLVLEFVKELEKHVKIKICFWDERFSSASAERVLLEYDLSRAKRKKIIDKIAASYILQNALDFIRFNH